VRPTLGQPQLLQNQLHDAVGRIGHQLLDGELSGGQSHEQRPPRHSWARACAGSCPRRRCPKERDTIPSPPLPDRLGRLSQGHTPAESRADRHRIRISIPAGCFKRDWNAGYGVFLLRQFNKPRECELIGSGGFRLRVNAVGEARGYVIAPARGHCFQHTYSRAATPGRYVVGFGCHACGGPTFTITSTRQPDSLEERD